MGENFSTACPQGNGARGKRRLVLRASHPFASRRPRPPCAKTPLHAWAFCAYGENFPQPIHRATGAAKVRVCPAVGAFMGSIPVCKRASPPPCAKRHCTRRPSAHMGKTSCSPSTRATGRSESAGLPGCGRLYGLYTRLQAGVPAPLCKTPLHA